MEYKINPGAIDEERKRKIEMHYRADVDILGVMLRKFGIVALEKRE